MILARISFANRTVKVTDPCLIFYALNGNTCECRRGNYVILTRSWFFVLVLVCVNLTVTYRSYDDVKYIKGTMAKPLNENLSDKPCENCFKRSNFVKVNDVQHENYISIT